MKKLHDYWFSPAPATRLAFIRILTGGFGLWYLLTRYSHFTAYDKADPRLFSPVGFSALLSEPMPVFFAQALYYATLIARACYLLGFRFRLSGPLFALLLMAALSYRYSWSMIYHDLHILAVHVLIIGLSASADAWSLDRRGDPGKTHWRYGWPVRLLSAATILTYFVSGAAKIFSELGWGWLAGSELKLQIAADVLRKEVLGESGMPLFKMFYTYDWLFTAMGVFTLIVELGAPLFLANRRLSQAWAACSWLMHWGIFLFMGIRFRYQLSGLVFLSFFEVEKIPARLARALRSLPPRPATASGTGAPAVVLFDGECNFCNAWVRFILKRDLSVQFYFASQQYEGGRNLLTRSKAPTDLSSLVLVEQGAVYVKSEAALRVMGKLGGAWSLLAVLRWIPRGLRDGAYDLFAAYRYRLFGRDSHCEMPPAGFSERVLD